MFGTSVKLEVDWLVGTQIYQLAFVPLWGARKAAFGNAGLV